jgi:TusA-related sulfurtransferase
MTEDTIVVDVSGLEPPMPLETITRHLRELRPHQKLKVIHRMFPCLLPDIAEKLHMKYRVLVQTEEKVELLIEHREG